MTIKAQMVELKRQNDELRQELAKLKQTDLVEELEVEIATLYKKNSELSGAVRGLKTANGHLDTKVCNLEKQIKDLKAERDRLKGSGNSAQAIVEKFKECAWEIESANLGSIQERHAFLTLLFNGAIACKQYLDEVRAAKRRSA